MRFELHNITVDSHITIIRPATKELIYYMGLWGMSHEKEIESLHTGSTGQTELPRDRVKAMQVLLPDYDVLHNFNEVIAPIAACSITNQVENQKLSAIRDSLLPKLMSGELPVSYH